MTAFPFTQLLTRVRSEIRSPFKWDLILLKHNHNQHGIVFNDNRIVIWIYIERSLIWYHSHFGFSWNHFLRMIKFLCFYTSIVGQNDIQIPGWVQGAFVHFHDLTIHLHPSSAFGSMKTKLVCKTLWFFAYRVFKYYCISYNIKHISGNE